MSSENKRAGLYYAGEGDKCPKCHSGILRALPTENCSCHINAPCGECTNPILECPECEGHFNGGANPNPPPKEEPRTVRTGFSLVSATRIAVAPTWDLKYVAAHSTPGRDGTTLETGIHVIFCPGNAKKVKLVEVDFGQLEGDSLGEVLRKLANWMDRTAEVISSTTEGKPVESWTAAFCPETATITRI